MNFEEIINNLKEGNARYVSDKRNNDLQDRERRNLLVAGQSPEVIVLSCADSRVVPEMIFDKGLGELFVVRVAGNIANTSSLASMEYAVAHCGSKIILVLGHQNCGAVTAAINSGDNGHNLNHLLAHIAPAIHQSGQGAEVNDVVKTNAALTAKQLLERSAIIRDAVQLNKLKVVPAYYELESGRVLFLNNS